MKYRVTHLGLKLEFAENIYNQDFLLELLVLQLHLSKG